MLTPFDDDVDCRVMAHAWHRVLQLSAVFFTASIVSAQDCSTQQDTGMDKCMTVMHVATAALLISTAEWLFHALMLCSLGPCLYIYENIHTAGICPKGIDARVDCRGQVPAESSVDIRWYWTRNEDEAGTLGTLLQTDGFKYITLLSRDGLVNGRTVFFSFLYVHSFNNTDTGFYWCQMVVHESRLLEPSCPMEITAVPTNGTSETDVCMDTGMFVQRKCADLIVITETSQFSPPTPSAPTAIMSESSLFTESPTTLPVPMHTGSYCMPPHLCWVRHSGHSLVIVCSNC